MELWINVGCGPHLAPKPWVNIDQNDTPYAECFDKGRMLERKPEVVANADNLPYLDHSVDRIYCGHLVEHLGLYNGEVFKVLDEFKRVVKVGGQIALVAPDVVQAAEQVWDKSMDWRWFWACHGAAGRGAPTTKFSELPGDEHKWSCSQEALYLLSGTVFGFGSVTSMDVMNIEQSWPVVNRRVRQSAVLVQR